MKKKFGLNHFTVYINCIFSTICDFSFLSLPVRCLNIRVVEFQLLLYALYLIETFVTFSKQNKQYYVIYQVEYIWDV